MSVSTYVYIGAHKSTEPGKLCTVWERVNEDGTLSDDTISFGYKKGRKAGVLSGGGVWIGDMYKIEKKGETTYCAGERIGPWKDDKKIGEWKLVARRHEAELASNKKLADIDFGGMTMDELRELYSLTIGKGARAALIACIVQHMTR